MTETPVLTHADAEGDASGKRRQILDGARRVFLDCGFDAASMNEIARAAGVSKGTLYVYFASKESLFEELIRHDKREQVEQVCWIDEEFDDIRSALIDMGCRLLSHMLEPDRIAQMRIVVAVSGRFPRVGRAFYEAGPEYGRQKLAAFLRRHAGANDLQIQDFDRAAAQFGDICKSYVLLRAILNVGEVPDAAWLQAHVSSSVDTFLRAYRVE